MPIRSHVDPCLFARFIYVDGSVVSPAVLEQIEGAPDQERYFAAWRAQHESTPHVIFHEAYHFWQGLRLPYVYWYALLSFRGVAQAFDTANSVGDVHEWDMLIPEFYRPRLSYQLFHVGRRSVELSTRGATPESYIARAVVSALDLLEAAASIAQYQATVGTAMASDPLAFARWCKRTPSYTRVFTFVARVLESEETALRSLLPLINTCFRTSDPVRAFHIVLAVLAREMDTVDEWLGQPEPLWWSGHFDEWLDAYAGFEGPPDSTTDLLKPTYCRLTLDHWTANSLEHPLLSKSARAWIEAAAENPVYGWAIDQPAWASDVLSKAREDFEPTATVVRFGLAGTGNRVFVMSREDRLTYDIRDLLTIWSVIRRAAGSHFDPDHRLCHHSSCPEFQANYCNSYPIIPSRFEDCGFPPRLKRIREGLRNATQEKGEMPYGAPQDLSW